jgi:hypothetical protein
MYKKDSLLSLSTTSLSSRDYHQIYERKLKTLFNMLWGACPSVAQWSNSKLNHILHETPLRPELIGTTLGAKGGEFV